MKAISIGDKYQVYGNSLQAYDSIPAYTYNVRFDEMTGFYLKVRSKLAVKEKTPTLSMDREALNGTAGETPSLRPPPQRPWSCPVKRTCSDWRSW